MRAIQDELNYCCRTSKTKVSRLHPNLHGSKDPIQRNPLRAGSTVSLFSGGAKVAPMSEPQPPAVEQDHEPLLPVVPEDKQLLDDNSVHAGDWKYYKHQNKVTHTNRTSPAVTPISALVCHKSRTRTSCGLDSCVLAMSCVLQANSCEHVPHSLRHCRVCSATVTTIQTGRYGVNALHILVTGAR